MMMHSHLLLLILASIGIVVSAIADDIDPNEFTQNSYLDKEGELAIEPRNDLDNVDFSSFFDFDSDDDDNFHSENSATESEAERPTKPPVHRHRYWFPPQYHKKHKSSSGKNDRDSLEDSTNDNQKDSSKEKSETSNTSTNFSTHIVGPYQVSVVDAKSPLLSSLGLNRDQLENWAAESNRRSSSLPVYIAPYSASESVRSHTYAEYPRQDQPSYGPHQPSHSPSPPPNTYSYEGPKHQASIGEHYKGSGEAVVYGNPSPHQGHGRYPQPSNPDYTHHHPPQGSYSHSSPQQQHSTHSSHRGGPHPSPSNYPHQPSNQESARSQEYSSQGQEYKRVLSPSDPNYNRGAWQQPSQAYPPHPPPLSGRPASESSSGYHGHYHPSSAPTKPSEKAPYSASYHPPKHSYGSVSSSSSAYHSSHSSHPSSHSYHAPASNGGSSTSSRNGALGYDGTPTYHEHVPASPSKPMITVRFKARAPDGSHGLQIPLNFNPLEVVKKLTAPLAVLNPLANKKVTIGITIENKDKHQEYQHEVHSY